MSPRESSCGGAACHRFEWRESHDSRPPWRLDRSFVAFDPCVLSSESGTGKELVARALHQRSPRADRPFVVLHCAALSEALLEGELFGHERGAFSGAIQHRAGCIEEADGGTLFVDEIDELSPNIQLKLLRVLQEPTCERVGSSNPGAVDVRFIAATNRDLRQLVADGKFREDLRDRLNVVNLRVPPLRARKGDVILLALHFLQETCLREGRASMSFDNAAWARLVSYNWPGNVRELKDAIERAVVLAPGTVIETAHLPPQLQERISADPFPPIPGSSLHELERYAILRTVEANGGSAAKAAKMLEISVRKVQYRLQQYSALPRERTSTPRPFRVA